MRRSLALVALLTFGFGRPIGSQVRLPDETDRQAFRAWFVLLADAQFYRQTPDVTDCASLVRHAFREALRAHTPEWLRLAALPLAPAYPDVRRPPRPTPNGWPLFRVADGRDAEFADAQTIISSNTRPLGRDTNAAGPGDLLYFHQQAGSSPDHLMVFLGPSVFDRSERDWVVYHTGPEGSLAGEVRKVRLRDLVGHPLPRWRPIPANPSFVGVFRLALL
jgi:uncharacterized protein YfaT (DUF1175 family)